MLQLHAMKGPTGRLLTQLLKDKGLLVGKFGQPKGVVNYGFHGGGHGLPTLNEHAGRLNKYQELVQLDKEGVRTVPFSNNALDLVAPILGRKLHHTKGNDILVYKVKPVWKGDKLSDFYTELVDKKREYRVWAFRGRHLATYEKVLTYKERLGRKGKSKDIWNWGNGYAFEFRQGATLPDKLKDLGCNAVEALNLDFGAVDIIEDKHGYFYVLEVNTAPGTQGAARQGITSLVNQIEKWSKNGFPVR